MNETKLNLFSEYLFFSNLYIFNTHYIFTLIKFIYLIILFFHLKKKFKNKSLYDFIRLKLELMHTYRLLLGYKLLTKNSLLLELVEGEMEYMLYENSLLLSIN